VYWIAYVTLGLAVGAIIGYVQGHKQGYVEGWDGCAELQRTAHQLRGRKAAETRRARSLAVALDDVVEAP
jgi:hypothetical protein